MHDDRVLTEQRLERVLRERIRPAIHGAAVPLEVAAWHVPGEPVPPAEGLAAESGAPPAAFERSPLPVILDMGDNLEHVILGEVQEPQSDPTEGGVDLLECNTSIGG